MPLWVATSHEHESNRIVMTNEASADTPPNTPKRMKQEVDVCHCQCWCYHGRESVSRLPTARLSAQSLPSELVLREIREELFGDCNPNQNLASFVTTTMEPEAETLMNEAMSKNLIDRDAYPASAELEYRCVSMLAKLYHCPGKVTGTSTVGSSEAIMLAVLAMKKRWIEKRQSEGKDHSKPNIILSSSVHICWKKAARFFEIEERYVFCSRDRFTMDPEEALQLVDDNTVGISSILGTTHTGHYEDVMALNDLLVSRGIDCPIHVDAASGGFVAPFVNPALIWDFRLEKVVSINVSGHKYGLVYSGIGWVVWRDSDFLPKDLVLSLNYLGIQQSSSTINFSRSASNIVGQYYQLSRLGIEGYRAIMLGITAVADYLARQLRELGFVILSETGGYGLPIVVFCLKDNRQKFDEFDIAHYLRERGWVVPAYTLAPRAEQMKVLRVVVRQDMSYSRCDSLIADLEWIVKTKG